MLYCTKPQVYDRQGFPVAARKVNLSSTAAVIGLPFDLAAGILGARCVCSILQSAHEACYQFQVDSSFLQLAVVVSSYFHCFQLPPSSLLFIFVALRYPHRPASLQAFWVVALFWRGGGLPVGDAILTWRSIGTDQRYHSRRVRHVDWFGSSGHPLA